MAKSITVDRAVNDLVASYPNQAKNISPRQIELIRREFSEISDDAVMYAVQMHLREGKFFPSLAELMTLARDYEHLAYERERNANCKDALAVKWHALEDDYFNRGELDESKWQGLADELRGAGREEASNRVLAKMIALKA